MDIKMGSVRDRVIRYETGDDGKTIAFTECSRCHELLPDESYKGSKSSRCKTCDVAYKKHLMESDPVHAAKVREYSLARTLMKLYGITVAEYKAMAEKQGGKCLICGIVPSGKYRGADKRLVVDHCHETGKIRGLLCANCNSGLGSFKDNPESMRAAANYIENVETSEFTVEVPFVGYVAAMLDISDLHATLLIHDGRLPAETFRMKGQFFWMINQSDVEAIKKACGLGLSNVKGYVPLK